MKVCVVQVLYNEHDACFDVDKVFISEDNVKAYIDEQQELGEAEGLRMSFSYQQFDVADYQQ